MLEKIPSVGEVWIFSGTTQYLWNEKRYLNRVNSIFLLAQLLVYVLKWQR